MSLVDIYLALLGGAVAGVVASGKGRNAVGWGSLGIGVAAIGAMASWLVLPVTGVIAASLVPPAQKQRSAWGQP